MFTSITCKKHDYGNPVDSSVTIAAPTSLEVTAVTESAVNLHWTMPPSDADYPNAPIKIMIERSTDGTSWTLVDSVGATITTKAVADVYKVGVTYSFRVKAKSLYQTSAYSTSASGGLILHDVPMVPVAGGTFQMGSNDANDLGASPPHTVTVGSFYIDKYEITYEKWTTVVAWGSTHGYTDIQSVGANGHNPVGSNNPVSTVNWYDIVKWCNARSEKDGLTPVYYTSSSFVPVNIYRTGSNDLTNTMVNWTANGYRLPTEAEWEFAARGGTKAKSPIPYIYSGSDAIDGVAWYGTNSGSTTHPVGGKTANELGIYDMSGNVWEWCWDWYVAYSAVAQTDPQGPSAPQSYRVLRGGSFFNDGALCRSAYRSYGNPVDRNYVSGFRCAQD